VGEFGDKFRNEREKKGISLDDVSNVTKIGSRMLQAIEEERFDQLPGGVFNKGFIRAYAKHLGLNDDDAVAQYLSCLRQAQIDAQASWQPPARTTASERRTPAAPAKRGVNSQPPPLAVTQRNELPEMHLPRAEHLRSPSRSYLTRREAGIPWGIVTVAAVIIVLAAVLWQRHSRGTQPEAGVNQPSATSTPTAQPASSAANPASGTRPAEVSTPNQSQSSGTRSAAVNPGSTTPQPSAGSDETAATVEPASSNSRTKAVMPLTLVIRASENSWVSVSADGQVATQETLIAPAHTSVRASREFVVKVGNAAGVSFLFNGKEIPPQGSESETKTLVFDSSGLKTAGAAPATVH
jgi:cytoskeletal protein RodZ